MVYIWIYYWSNITMRYEYKITPINKEQETIEAMSYKKMLKTLVNK